MKITSLQNTLVKRIVKLRDRPERDQTGLTLIEGVREICRAQEAGVKFQEIFVCHDLLMEDEFKRISRDPSVTGVNFVEVTKDVFSKMSFGNRQEGVLAIARQPKGSFKDFKFKENPFLIIVEKVEKPGNLGAILRTSDAAGVDGLIVCDGETDLYNPNVIRASLGTIFSVKVIETSSDKAFSFLKQQGIKICSTSPSAKTLYTQANLNIPLAIVMGSEEEGLSPFWMQHSDLQVKIPMMGKADSLNVSVTTAIMLYESLRQREN